MCVIVTGVQTCSLPCSCAPEDLGLYRGVPLRSDCRQQATLCDMDKGDSDVHGKGRWQEQVQGLGRAAEALPPVPLVEAIAGAFLFSEGAKALSSEERRQGKSGSVQVELGGRGNI